MAQPAQTLSTQDVYRATSKIVIDGKLDDRAWQQAPAFSAFHFNWWKEGEKEKTVAKMLWDDENLYVGYYCHDKHISASVTERHGPVSKDDCVEIFISPNPEKLKNYYTFEINVIGTMLNRCKTDWWTGPPTWEPEGVRYRTSHHGLKQKLESPDDDHWSVELAIPFRNFTRDAAATPPRNGDRWRLNLNRTGGITNKQNSTWSPVPPPAEGFHTPEGFGWVRFVNQPAPGAQASRQRRDSRSEQVLQVKHSPEDIIAGRVLYNRSCTACHGLDGEVGDRAPALAGARRYLRRMDEDIFDAIKAGIPGTLMPPMGLSATDTWKVVAYVRSLRATAFDDVLHGDVARGEKVFWGKGKCGDCHMLNGRGGLAGPDLSSIAAERTSGFLKESLTKRRPASRGYKPVKITLTGGGEISGVLKNEHNFSYQVLDRQNKLHLLTGDEVQKVSHGTESLMPSNFDKTLSPAELQDVLAFLSRQAASRIRQERLGVEDLLQ